MPLTNVLIVCWKSLGEMHLLHRIACMNVMVLPISFMISFGKRLYQLFYKNKSTWGKDMASKDWIFWKRRIVLESGFMMKRYFVFITVLAVILTFCGCVKTDPSIMGETKDEANNKTNSSLHGESNEADMDSRQELILAVIGSANNLYQDKVKIYNRAQEDVRITIKVYEDEDAFITELIAGKIPDLVDLSEAKVYGALKKKGLLENLKTYFAKDESIKEEDFLEKSMEFYANGDKLYAIPNGIRISAMMGDSKALGDRQKWSFEEYVVFVNNLSNRYAVTRVLTKQTMLRHFCLPYMNEFVDETAQSCDFKNNTFYVLLASAAIYSERELEDAEWPKVFEEMGSGEVSLIPIEIHDVTTYELWKGFFANTGRIIGFPAKEGNGVYLKPTFQALAMTSTGKNPNAAWDFTKFVLTSANNGYVAFPSYKPYFDEMLENARKTARRENTTGTASVGNLTVGMVNATLEEIDFLEKCLLEGTVVQNENEEVLQIIGDEAEAYFNGQKAPEQVADLIEKRLKLYLAEQ